MFKQIKCARVRTVEVLIVALSVLSAGSILLTGCGQPSVPSASKPAPGFLEPALYTEPTPVVFSLVYQDDFSDQDSGWDDAFDEHTMKQYGAHEYHIEVNAPNLFAWGLANRAISDFVLEVKAKQWEGPDNNSYGVIFRYQDPHNFYRFDVTGDGFFLLSKLVDGNWLTLVDWTPSPAVNQGEAENKLRVSCLGQHIAVYVNGELLAEVDDESFRQGDIGFFAGTFDEAGVHISFDDLQVWAPPGSAIALKATATPEPTAPPASGSPSPAAGVPLAATRQRATPRTESADTPVTEALPGYVSAVQPKPKDASELKGRIAYPVFDPDRGTFDVFVLDLETNESRKVLQNASQPALDRQGQYIAYRSWDNDKRGLISRDLGATEEWRFTTFSEAARPRWSPDGETILFHSREESDRVSRLYRTQDGEVRGLRRDGEVIKGESPDFAGSEALVYKGCVGNDCGLILSALDGSAPRQLTDDLSDTAPAGSPGGSQIAFMSRRSGSWDIYVMDADGSNLTNLTPVDSNEGLPTWSPAGDFVAFLSDRNGSWGLWVMAKDGSNPYQVRQLEGSPDGKVRTAQAFESLGWVEEQISWSP